MSTILVVLLIIFAIILIIFPIIGICLEKKDFNNGICPDCGAKLRLFDMDSSLSRGYCCDKCSYHTWVSWSSVDHDFLWKEGLK